MSDAEKVQAHRMISEGWAPIEYRSPYDDMGEFEFIQWNGIYEKWFVLNHETISEKEEFDTPLLALGAMLNARPKPSKTE